MMHCPYCSDSDTKVLESRIINSEVRRRRECLQCQTRFTTYEKAFFNFTVLKKDGREEPFNIDKIKLSLQKSCNKLEETQLLNLTRKSEQKILGKKLNQVKTKEIGRVVLKELKKHDKIAYVRYATIHKEIEDPRLLEKELQTIV
jgi:transcriptional repressor NrdR